MKTYLAVVIAVVLLPLAFAPELNSQTTLELLQLRPCVSPANAVMIVAGKWQCVQLAGVSFTTTTPPTVTLSGTPGLQGPAGPAGPTGPQGPAGSGTAGPTQVVGEVTVLPSAQSTLSAAFTPLSGTLAIWLNGIRLSLGTDYTFGGAVITFTASQPQAGDIVSLDYAHN